MTKATGRKTGRPRAWYIHGEGKARHARSQSIYRQKLKITRIGVIEVQEK